MNAVAQISTGIAATVLITVFAFEGFLIDRPWVQKALGSDRWTLRPRATCTSGRSTSVMGVSDLLGFWKPRGGSVRGTIGSAILPAVALVAIAA